ncbi:PA14 domain-containing protein [Microseira wollei]|uniref:PA14 domain-containing protein n=1 Tax=Microseira wollei TaxID=467598 RepID=UPI001CFCDC08|nr:PA14 domain-containing protein [Microseira wollei]
MATDPDYNAKMNLAFGDNFDTKVANDIVQKFAKANFTELPSIEIVPSAAINGANGAFDKATNRIYLSSEFVAENAGNPGAITSVLLEETGHYIDSKINISDATGDEGDIFARLLQGQTISTGELLGLKAEDDTATVAFNGQNYFLEMSRSPIQGSIGSFYYSNPNIARDLGESTGNEVQFAPGKWRQDFQRGAIFHSSNGTFSVRGSLGKYYLNIGGQNSQLGLPTGEEVHIGNGNWQQNFEKGFIDWRNNGTGQVILIPANNWRGEYFSNINLTDKPVFFENLGDGSRGFSRNWGNNSPSLNIPTDNFSARMTTQRYLAPGLYKITTQADDGIRVRIGNQTVVDKWVDQPFVTNSGYFYSNGSNFPIAIEYYERGVGAAINFNITPATKFQDSVNESQQWKATVFNWNGSQGNQPPINFWNGEMNNQNAIGVINLGSNTRSDGKKGINFDWGDGAPNRDGNRLPHNNFAIGAYTWADFDGSPYKFRVRGDDGFQIRAKNHSTGEWFDITVPNQWTQAYGFTEITKALPAGRYDLAFNYYEHGGLANFDLSWEKPGNPDIDIQLVRLNGFTDQEWQTILKAEQNWERIITNDMFSSDHPRGGVLKVAVVKEQLNGGEAGWFAGTYDVGKTNPVIRDVENSDVDRNGVDYDNIIQFNTRRFQEVLKNNWLVRVAMHEIGNTLGLTDDNSKPNLMRHGSFDPIMDGNFDRLTNLGYKVDRNVPIYWS